MLTQYGQDVVRDYVWHTKLLTNRSYRPIFDVAVYTEHVRVAQALYCITKLGLPARNIQSINTDAIAFQVPLKLRLRIAAELPALRFCDLANLRGQLEHLWFDETRRRCVETKPATTDCTHCVFRVRDGKPLTGKRVLPRQEHKVFLTQAEPEDVAEERARELVRAGHSLLILGPPGTGKTHLMKELVTQLKGAGKNVVVIA